MNRLISPNYERLYKFSFLSLYPDFSIPKLSPDAEEALTELTDEESTTLAQAMFKCINGTENSDEELDEQELDEFTWGTHLFTNIRSVGYKYYKSGCFKCVTDDSRIEINELAFEKTQEKMELSEKTSRFLTTIRDILYNPTSTAEACRENLMLIFPLPLSGTDNKGPDKVTLQEIIRNHNIEAGKYIQEFTGNQYRLGHQTLTIVWLAREFDSGWKTPFIYTV